jgi:tetratricopeptide (TPR) repeat protein
MTTLDREQRYIRKWRAKAARGDCSAMLNVAAAYRILEKFRLAARWYERAAEHGDGDALTEWGYCLHHGVGTRKDEVAAIRAYRAAIAAKWVTDYSREEAMYHLAVLLIKRHSTASRRTAVELLCSASADGNYPQAEALLQVLKLADGLGLCVCRRHLRPRLARRHCPLHGPYKGEPDASANGHQPTCRVAKRAPVLAGPRR